MSLFLTIYFLFLLSYAGVLSFAVYKVFLFAKNKDFKGYSRRITLAFVIAVLFVVFVSLLIIQRYEWNDSFDYWLKQIMPDDSIFESVSKFPST